VVGKDKMKRKAAAGNVEVLLNAFQKDALTELGNIASGHAVTALSEMTGMTMEVEVPTVDVMVITAAKKQLDAEKLVAGISLQLDGGFSGYLEVLFPGKSALRLVDSLMGRMPGETMNIETEMEESVLKEIGNVLASSFCDAIAEFFQFSLLPSPPSFSFGMLGAVVEKGMTAVTETKENVQHIIRFKYVFENENENDIHGYILLFPHSRELKNIVSLLEAKVA
jgi:chemotaxis protein CheC